MTQRHIHYEAAFEDYLRSRGWPYIPVDEQKKAIFAGARIKSFDFLVYRPGERTPGGKHRLEDEDAGVRLAGRSSDCCTILP